jgi:hypothetical protein
MSDERKKPWYLQLPAKLTAGVVFLVAVTTLAGNLLELNEKRRVLEQPASPAPAASAQPVEPTRPEQPQAAGPSKRRISVDRITVGNDGSPGTTDWRFMVEADGESLFAFREDDLDDTVDRNVATPRDAAAVLRVAAGNGAKLTIKGWRGSRFRLPGGAPDVVGQGALSPGGAIAPIRVASAAPGGAAFVFHLSADGS